MAMERHYTITDTHSRSITALGYHPARREVLVGFEDGTIKTWEAEAGKLVLTTKEHKGWVTDFLYWSDGKLTLSSSNDGLIIAWSSGGQVYDVIDVNQPVYSMALSSKREQLVCGLNASVRLFQLDEYRDSGHVVNINSVTISREHTDIVRCVVCHDSRIYTAGYDQQLIIYEVISSVYPDQRGMKVIYCNPRAHDAGIIVLILNKDTDNNTWMVTGSFDKVVKIWSQDGQLTYRLDGFVTTVTDLCYVPRNRTLWVACGSPNAWLYDPKSGENVSEFIGSNQDDNLDTCKYHLQLLKYFPELNEVVASTSRRHIMIWKYNPHGCVTTITLKHPIHSLTYTHKVPILLFSGSADGVVNKWERLQANHFMYSTEPFPFSEAQSKLAELKGLLSKNDPRCRLKSSSRKLFPHQNRPISSQYYYRNPAIPTASSHTHPNTGLLCATFVESLDLLIVGCEDSNIYVWGFDPVAVKVLSHMEPPEKQELVRKYSILLHHDTNYNNTTDKQSVDHDSVTNRVAGFICRNVLSGHVSCITSLVVIPKEAGFKSTYMLSGSWDRRISIWDLEKGKLHDTFRNGAPDMYDSIELACDGIILDMDYCVKRNEFAYASADKLVYIRKFHPNGSRMPLVNTLQGHDREVTQVKWNIVIEKWVTGAEDGSVRIWTEDGMSCLQALNVHGPVTALCVDMTNGCIIVGAENAIKVFDPEDYRQVQTNHGHTDAIHSIIHIPERHQYVSGSADKTIRIWNAFRKVPRKKHVKMAPQDGTTKSGPDSPDTGELTDDD